MDTQIGDNMKTQAYDSDLFDCIIASENKLKNDTQYENKHLKKCKLYPLFYHQQKYQKYIHKGKPIVCPISLDIVEENDIMVSIMECGDSFF